MKNFKFFPDVCHNCNTDLVIEQGKSDDTLKLRCMNQNCSGAILKKLQKGIEILEIKGLGPSTIKKLYEAGLRDIVDLFDKTKINEDVLIKSGQFKKGRALEKILDSIKSTKSIPIDKAICSLQITVKKKGATDFISIGKSLSLQIANLLSNISYDFEGLSIQIREDIRSGNSEVLKDIKMKLSKFVEFDISVVMFETKVRPTLTSNKTVTKQVFLAENVNIEIPSNLDWGVLDSITSECNLIIVESKLNNPDLVQISKEKGIKLLTTKQVKLLFF